MKKLLVVAIAILSACGVQPAESQSVANIGLTKVNHSGSPLSGSGTTTNPLDMLLSVTSPLTGTGSNGSPLSYGLNASGGYFGNGRDGALNFDGTTTVTAVDMSLVPATCCGGLKRYIMTRDIHATTIDVQENVLLSGPYRVIASGSINLHYNAGTGAGGWIGNVGNDAALSVAAPVTASGSLCGASAGSTGGTGVGIAGVGSGTPRPRGMPGSGGTGAGGTGVSAGGAGGTQGTSFLAQNGDIHDSAFAAINMRTAKDVAVQTSVGGGSSGGAGGGGGVGRLGGGSGSGGGCLVIAAPSITGTRGAVNALANCNPSATCLGVLSVHGGHGGNGAVAAGTATGGGGAGAGGLLVVVNADGVIPGYEIFSGRGGTGTNGGTNGQTFKDGLLIYFNVGAH